jgi:hypothetical protein
MKVSRKVGRRSRSSVSRRRLRNKKTKSGYKKKYAKTQKGGKRGRSYKRVRTHKRGRRFHRGGFGCDSLTTKDYGDRRIYYGDTWITYNKKGFPEFSLLFEVCFEIKFMQENSDVRIIIIFTRKPTHGQLKSESPTFVVELLRKYSEVITFLDRILEDFTITHITESDSEYNYDLGILQAKKNVKKPLRIYRFTSPNNTKIFKTIIDCIKKKLKHYFENKYPGISFEKNFSDIPSKVNIDSDSGSSVDYTEYVTIDQTE